MKNLSQKKKPFLVLAPMAGITDLPFRLVCKSFGADVLYSEMISAAGLFYESKKKGFDLTKFAEFKSLALAASSDEDEPLIVQLFGCVPEHFGVAAKIFNDANSLIIKRPAGIDINLGCPVKKVMRQGAGCALMESPDSVREIIQVITKNTDLPISLKIRAGIGKVSALTFLEKLKDLPWKTVMIHGRTFAQGFSGEINLELIEKIKQNFPDKIVIANGGIDTPEKALEIWEKTEADGLAIGRGALGIPWIFSQIKDFLVNGKYAEFDFEKNKEVALKHLDLAFFYLPKNAFLEIRKHLLWYFKDFPCAKELRRKILIAQNREEVINVLRGLKV